MSTTTTNYPIKRRHTGEVLFTIEGANDLRDADLRDADLRDADLRGADLRGANLRGANLRGANLRDANLRHANLRGADLRHADLRDADLRDANLRGACFRNTTIAEGAAVNQPPLVLYGGTYNILIWDEHMQIGCEFHPINTWFAFTDREILALDGKPAAEFWARWKTPLQNICAADNRPTTNSNITTEQLT